jgi:hypothetical protein
MAAGAEWVCVADIRIRSAGIRVFSRAISLARSSNSRGIMQLSTTTIASRVAPSSRTRLLARTGSTSRVARFCKKPPFTKTGNVGGAMSTAQAPARNCFGSRVFDSLCRVGSSAGHARLESRSTRKAIVILRFKIVSVFGRSQSGSIPSSRNCAAKRSARWVCSSASRAFSWARWRSALRCLTNSA